VKFAPKSSARKKAETEEKKRMKSRETSENKAERKRENRYENFLFWPGAVEKNCGGIECTTKAMK
jgi:hypothetical protein